MTDLAKLRKVLDYVPSKALVGSADRTYYDALNRRLHREVTVERPPAPRARDEAVLVVSPEEWDAAQRAREHAQDQQQELELTRSELEQVRARGEALEAEVNELRSHLSGMKVEQEQRKTVRLQLLGVRRAAVEPAPAPTGWEVVPEPAAPAPPEPDLPPAEPAPEVPSEDEIAAADQAIQRVEEEIERIERELRDLAQEEERLRTSSGGYQHRGYTLYRRSVGPRHKPRDFYFFSKATPESGEPSPLPSGYTVAVRPRTGLPYLKRTQRSKPSKRGR